MDGPILTLMYMYDVRTLESAQNHWFWMEKTGTMPNGRTHTNFNVYV